MANSGIGIGESAMNLGQWETALDALRRAKKAGEEIGSYRHISSAYDREGDIYHGRGELERALSVFRDCDAILDRYAAGPGSHLTTWHRIGQALWDLGRLDEARAVMLRTVATAEAYRKARPTNLYRTHVLINSHGQTAGLLGGREPAMRLIAEALPHARAAFALSTELIARDAADANSRSQFVEISGWIAPVFRAADPALLGQLERQLAASASPAAAFEAVHGYSLAGLGRHREAIPLFQSAVARLGRPDRIGPALLLARTLVDWSDSLRATGVDGAPALRQAESVVAEWAARVPAHAGFRVLRDSVIRSRMASMPIGGRLVGAPQAK